MKTILPAAALALLAGCASTAADSDPVPAKAEIVRSAQARDTSPTLTDDETATLMKGEAAFAIDVLKTVTVDKADENVFLSPHSISIALGMTYAGARGETAAEMKKALHFDLPDDRVHAGFDYLDLQLSPQHFTKNVRLSVANSIWGQKGIAFAPAFLDTLAIDYGTGLNVLDFRASPEPSRVTINDWVSKKTESKINDLLPEDVITADTKIVLVNAVYFNAQWANKFTKESTSPQSFTKLDGTSTLTPMMHARADYSYASTDAYEAVEMPYEGNRLSMLVIMPKEGSFKTWESALTGDKVLDVVAGLQPTDLVVALPKLKLEQAFDLSHTLDTMGMKKAFKDEADFSGLTTATQISISAVVHKTFLQVDEEGTEAAAATAVVAAGSSSGPIDVQLPKYMTIDHPFITAIIDNRTKTLVFVGRIVQPAEM